VREPIVLSWSGGKDSSLALAALRREGRFELVALMTSVTEMYDRVSIHGVRRSLLRAQARAIGLPLVEITLEAPTTNDAYEAAFLRAAQELKARFPRLRHLAFGDLYLADVRAYRERLVAAAGMKPVFPLWGEDTAALAASFVSDGYRAHLVCVDTEQLGAQFAGHAFDTAFLAALPASVDPCGENGEFHTFVSDGPIFSTTVPVLLGELVIRDERFAYRDLLPALAETANAVAQGQARAGPGES
jgi:uncharacterized protein (TIGR00290 family)